MPPVERPSVSSNCIVTCSSPPARARPPARKFSSRRTPSSAVVETTCASRMMASSSTTTSPSPSSASSSSGLAAAAACSRVRPRRLVELCGPPCHAGSLWCHDTRSVRHAPGKQAYRARTLSGPGRHVPPVRTALGAGSCVSASRGTCSRASRPSALPTACTAEPRYWRHSPRPGLRPRGNWGSPSHAVRRAAAPCARGRAPGVHARRVASASYHPFCHVPG